VRRRFQAGIFIPRGNLWPALPRGCCTHECVFAQAIAYTLTIAHNEISSSVSSTTPAISPAQAAGSLERHQVKHYQKKEQIQGHEKR